MHDINCDGKGTDIDLIDFGKEHFRHFRGIFMRGRLPKKPWVNDGGISKAVVARIG